VKQVLTKIPTAITRRNNVFAEECFPPFDWVKDGSWCEIHVDHGSFSACSAASAAFASCLSALAIIATCCSRATTLGSSVGGTVGVDDGAVVGSVVGNGVGVRVGAAVGAMVGEALGTYDGLGVVLVVGIEDGTDVGADVRADVGAGERFATFVFATLLLSAAISCWSCCCWFSQGVGANEGTDDGAEEARFSRLFAALCFEPWLFSSAISFSSSATLGFLPLFASG
jgi:hypothetical protein